MMAIPSKHWKILTLGSSRRTCRRNIQTFTQVHLGLRPVVRRCRGTQRPQLVSDPEDKVCEDPGGSHAFRYAGVIVTYAEYDGFGSR
jgi:hypothetical protein